MTFMLAIYPDIYTGQRHYRAAYTVHFISAFYTRLLKSSSAVSPGCRGNTN